MRSKKLITLMVILIAFALGYFEKDEMATVSDNKAEVTFLDVGQGDCAVIRLNESGEVILVDTGEAEFFGRVTSYLDRNNIDTINHLVATHPHSDHIGSMWKIVDKYNIENVYMPRVSNDTKTFERLLTSIKNKGLKATEAKAGVTLSDGEVKAYFVAPVSDEYEELNDYSAVLKIICGDVAFLFTGDAEKLSENEILQNGTDLKAEVLKVGHHGSDTSSGAQFLRNVMPDYAIISADGESYGHPHKEVLDRLIKTNPNIEILGTYEYGNITFTTDGKVIEYKADR